MTPAPTSRSPSRRRGDEKKQKAQARKRKSSPSDSPGPRQRAESEPSRSGSRLRRKKQKKERSRSGSGVKRLKVPRRKDVTRKYEGRASRSPSAGWRRSLSREPRRKVSVTPSPSPPPRPVRKPSPKREQVVLDRRDNGSGYLDRSPPRGRGEHDDRGPPPPRGQVNDDSYRAEVNEGWLLDRVNIRAKTVLSQWEIFPRSPTPKREAAGPAKVDVPPEMSKEEVQRNDKFQAQLQKAAKTEAKAEKKKKKEKGDDDDAEADKKKKKEKGDDNEAEASKKKKKGKGDDDDAEEAKEKKDKKDKKEKADKEEDEVKSKAKGKQKEAIVVKKEGGKKTKEEALEKDSSGGSDSSDSDSSSSSGKKKKKKKKKKDKKKKSSSSSDGEDGEEELVEEVEWIELPPPGSSEAAKYGGGYNYDSEDEGFGPQPAHQQDLINSMSQSKGSYGGALLPGEGDAMAEYVKSGLRIPRRGEVGITADQIENLEAVGYVMSGSRHRRMNAVRIRKENQVYSAEEKRALAMYNFEEKANRESMLVGELREMLEKRQKAIATCVGDGQTLDDRFASIGEQKKFI
mmetsp:Transcript_36989/g.59316  ORF Transcript_36989/g.59316 Transcript_36989/m.59316 type:complete len:571 (+) Transcript_36989:96-1808(+)